MKSIHLVILVLLLSTSTACQNREADCKDLSQTHAEKISIWFGFSKPIDGSPIPPGISCPSWNKTIEVSEHFAFGVHHFPIDPVSDNIIELWKGDEQISLDRNDFSYSNNGYGNDYCPESFDTYFRPHGKPSGEYKLVYRTSGKRVPNCDGKITKFQGDDALVATISYTK